MKKNILHISTATKLFGSEKALLELLRVNDPEFRHFLILPAEGELADLFRREKITVLILDLNKTGFLRATLSLARLIKKECIAVMHVNYHADLPRVYFAAKLAHIPLVVHMRMTAGLSIVEMFLFNLTDRIICVSEAVRAMVIAQKRLRGVLKVRHDRILVVHDGIDINSMRHSGDRASFRKEYGLTDAMRAVGIVGAIAPRKRQHLFVLVAAEIIKELKNIEFFIVGDLYGDRHMEYKDSVVAMIKSLRLENDIKITGRRNDMPSVMKGLDLLMCLSEHEAFGLVVLEALSVGTPVLASNTEGIKEIIGDNNGGVLLANDDPVEIAQIASALISDRQKNQDLRESALKRAEKFDIGNSVNGMNRIFSALLGSRHG